MPKAYPRLPALNTLLCAVWFCVLFGSTAGHAGGLARNRALLQHPTVWHRSLQETQKRGLQECPAGDLQCQINNSQCRPSSVEPEYRCQLAQQSPACTDGDQFVELLPLWYCTTAVPQWVVGVALSMLSLMLFYSMSTIAEHFLVPAVQFMSKLLRLPSDIAGITLFAFATGAPDIFTQLAAINEGEHVDIQLAVSSTLGSGLFIICVVLAVVLLLTPETIHIPEPGTYIRDAAAYFVACVMTMAVMWDDSLHAWEALLLLGAYIAYLTVCLATCKYADEGPVYAAVPMHCDEEQAVEMSGLSGGARALEGALSECSSVPSCGSNASLGLKAITLPASRKAADVDSDDKWDSRSEDSVVDLISSIGRRRALSRDHAGPTQPIHNTELHLLAPAANPHNYPAFREPQSPRATAAMSAPAVIEQVESGETAAEQSILVGRRPSKPAGDYWVNSTRAARGCSSGMWGRVAAGYRAIVQQLHELLHLSHVPRWLQLLAVACAPMVLAMHATNPSVAPGLYTRKYCVLLAVCAPMLWGVKLGALHWSPCAWTLSWVAASALLLLLLLLSFKPNSNGKAYRANTVLSLLSFIQSMLWMSLLADEVAAMFESLGALWDIQADELGATLLAWGETFPDLVSSIAIVRTGQSMMAISAAFGGPTLNLLVGTGASVLCAIVRKGTVPAELTNGIAMLVASSLLVLFVVMAVPALRGWRVGRKLGIALLGLYAVSLVLFFLSDSQVVVKHVSVAGGIHNLLSINP